MSSEVLAALEASNRAFEQFKNANDARLSALEFGESKAEAKGNRPRLGGTKSNDDGAPDLKAFRKFVRTGDDAELKALESKSMSIGSNPDGGYSLPKVISTEMERLELQINPMRGLAKVRQVSTPDFHELVTVVRATNTWVSESAARPATTSPQFADVRPSFGELYAFPQATQQVLDDAFFNVDSWLAGELADTFGSAEGNAFLNGSGTNQPTGLLTGTPVATADSSRAFGVLQYVPTGVANDWAASNPQDILIKTMQSLKARYRPGASWLVHPTILQDILTWKASGTGAYVFQPAMDEGAPPTLWGYPVFESEFMPTKAANAFGIAFGNFQRGYLIADRIGQRILRDPFSSKPYIGFYATRRTGGCILNSEAIRLVKFAVS